jgi:hypothetical protein
MAGDLLEMDSRLWQRASDFPKVTQTGSRAAEFAVMHNTTLNAVMWSNNVEDVPSCQR